MKIISGDLLELAEDGLFDVIVHGVNCEQSMGAGFAKHVKKEYPETSDVDNEYNLDPARKLGSISGIKTKKDEFGLTNHQFYIINGYTQLHAFGYGTLVDYDAIRSVFANVKDHFSGLRIGYLKIGAGKARGDWDIIEAIIEEELAGEDHTLVLR